jgi:hypothetical protein
VYASKIRSPSKPRVVRKDKNDILTASSIEGRANVKLLRGGQRHFLNHESKTKTEVKYIYSYPYVSRKWCIYSVCFNSTCWFMWNVTFSTLSVAGWLNGSHSGFVFITLCRHSCQWNLQETSSLLATLWMSWPRACIVSAEIYADPDASFQVFTPVILQVEVLWVWRRVVLW